MINKLFSVIEKFLTKRVAMLLPIVLALLPLAAKAQAEANVTGLIEPGVYTDTQGGRYRVDRGGVTVTGRVPFRIRQEKQGGFHAMFMTGEPEGHPFWAPNIVKRIGAPNGPIYGFFSSNMLEPFCLGAPLVLTSDADGAIHIGSFRNIHDAASRNCAFSNEGRLRKEPTHVITLMLANKDDSRSSPIGAKGELIPGEYGDGGPEHHYRLERVKTEHGRNLWRFAGGERKRNFQGVSASFMDGPSNGHPLFSGRKFDLQMPEGLVFGMARSGWDVDPFCNGSVLALVPVGKLLEVVSFAAVSDAVSRSCMFVAGAAAQEMPSASFTLFPK